MEEVAQNGPERALILCGVVVGILQRADRRKDACGVVRTGTVGRLILQELRIGRICPDGHGVVVRESSAQIVDAVREVGVIQVLNKPRRIGEQRRGRVDLAVGGDVLRAPLLDRGADIAVFQRFVHVGAGRAQRGEPRRHIAVALLAGILGKREVREAVFRDHADMHLVADRKEELVHMLLHLVVGVRLFQKASPLFLDAAEHELPRRLVLIGGHHGPVARVGSEGVAQDAYQHVALDFVERILYIVDLKTKQLHLVEQRKQRKDQVGGRLVADDQIVLVAVERGEALHGVVVDHKIAREQRVGDADPVQGGGVKDAGMHLFRAVLIEIGIDDIGRKTARHEIDLARTRLFEHGVDQIMQLLSEGDRRQPPVEMPAVNRILSAAGHRDRLFDIGKVSLTAPHIVRVHMRPIARHAVLAEFFGFIGGRDRIVQQVVERAEIAGRLAAQQGAILSGGHANYQKAAEIVLQDFRGGALGKITLETPDKWAEWFAAALQIEKEKQAKQALQKEMRKK